MERLPAWEVDLLLAGLAVEFGPTTADDPAPAAHGDPWAAEPPSV